ncbi:MAG: hypothetical protein MZV70_17710 [Desulfobacterales bacterium]|nr:hypothetical protein [Desulfobacterales bacterium]
MKAASRSSTALQRASGSKVRSTKGRGGSLTTGCGCSSRSEVLLSPHETAAGRD